MCINFKDARRFLSVLCTSFRTLCMARPARKADTPFHAFPSPRRAPLSISPAPLPFYPMRTRHGFTILEMLLSIGILAVLAAILLPVVNSAGQKAQTTTCMANLKTLWSAQRSYQSDHADSFIAYSGKDTWAWTAVLMAQGYLSEPTKVYFCPAFPKTTDLKTPERVARRTGGNGGVNLRGTYSHYGYNYNHIGGSTRYTGDPDLPARGSQITQPSRTILFVDTIYNAGAAVPRGTFLAVDRPGSSHMPHPRHQGRFQIVFVDGHVETMQPADPAQIYAPYPAGVGHTTREGSLWKR